MSGSKSSIVVSVSELERSTEISAVFPSELHSSMDTDMDMNRSGNILNGSEVACLSK